MRLFVALDPPRAVLEEAERAAAHLRARVPGLAARWVDPRQGHLTLAFLGEVGDERMAALQRALAGAAARGRAFDLATGHLGAFPSVRRASVLWLGFDGDTGSAADLAAAVESAATEAVRGRAGGASGRAGATQRFVPHLTLCRVRGLDAAARAGLPAAIAAWQGIAAPWPVDHLTLVRSHLGSGGPRYETLARFALG